MSADRAAPVLSVIMARAEDYVYRAEGSNPCRGTRRYRRKGRECFLSPEEVRRLARALSEHEADRPMCVAIVRLLLLTRCRKREIVTVRGSTGTPTSTLRTPRPDRAWVWLSSPAQRILEEQPRTSACVFPSGRIRGMTGKPD